MPNHNYFGGNCMRFLLFVFVSLVLGAGLYANDIQVTLEHKQAENGVEYRIVTSHGAAIVGYSVRLEVLENGKATQRMLRSEVFTPSPVAPVFGQNNVGMVRVKGLPADMKVMGKPATLSIEAVVFADGKSWGSDEYGQLSAIRGRVQGFSSALTMVKLLLEQKGEAETKRFLNEVAASSKSSR